MKALIVVIFFYSAVFALSNSIPEIPEYLKVQLARIKYDLLPEVFKNAPKSEKISGWCCANEQPVNTIQRTKMGHTQTVSAIKVLTGYGSCGFLGTGKCSKYEVRYVIVTTYYIDTYEVPNAMACPDQHVKCCREHILVADTCWRIEMIVQNLDLLLSLGLLSTIKPGR